MKESKLTWKGWTRFRYDLTNFLALHLQLFLTVFFPTRQHWCVLRKLLWKPGKLILLVFLPHFCSLLSWLWKTASLWCRRSPSANNCSTFSRILYQNTVFFWHAKLSYRSCLIGISYLCLVLSGFLFLLGYFYPVHLLVFIHKCAGCNVKLSWTCRFRA